MPMRCSQRVRLVHGLQMAEVEIDTPLLLCRVAAGVVEPLHQCQQGRQPHLVVFRSQAFLQVAEAALRPQRFHHSAGHGHLDAEETVSLAILPLAGLEETHQPFHLSGVGLGKHRLIQKIHHASSLI